jgi:Putative zinc- or iron-chelating domain
MTTTLDALRARMQQPADVPCGGCTACCRNDRVYLDPRRGDDLTAYRWHIEGGSPVLDRRPDGACVYLTAQGCGIHGRAPDVCRRMDCRVLVRVTPPAWQRMREATNPTMATVYAAGRERANSLDMQE